MDIKAADTMFPTPVMNIREPSSSSPMQPRPPPVPPKEQNYRASPTKDGNTRMHGKEIRVQKEWDVERGISQENDRQPLDPGRRGYNSRW